MTPAGAGVIDDADEDFFAEVLREFGDDGLHLFGAASACFEDNFIRIGADQFDAECSAGTAADEKGGIRMCDFKWYGRERALRAIEVAFIGADPKLAVVAAGVARLSWADGVALDGLGGERGAGGGPIGEVALFEAEIENATVGGGCFETFFCGVAPDAGFGVGAGAGGWAGAALSGIGWAASHWRRSASLAWCVKTKAPFLLPTTMSSHLSPLISPTVT